MVKLTEIGGVVHNHNHADNPNCGERLVGECMLKSSVDYPKVTPDYQISMPRPVPKPSQTKKVRGKKTIDNIDD